MDYLHEIKHFYAKHIESYTGKPPIGCREEEITELENKTGYSLPEAYRQYLKWMGKDYYGAFFVSNDFITDIINWTEWLPEFLAKSNIDFKLPEHYLVFYWEASTSIWFELPKENDNPTIYYFNDSKSILPSGKGKFTDILFEEIQGLASYLDTTHKEDAFGGIMQKIKRLSSLLRHHV